MSKANKPWLSKISCGVPADHPELGTGEAGHVLWPSRKAAIMASSGVSRPPTPTAPPSASAPAPATATASSSSSAPAASRVLTAPCTFLGDERVEVFVAEVDSHRRALIRAPDLARACGCANNRVSMFLSRRKKNDWSRLGIFQASAFLRKPAGGISLKAGSYFVALQACEAFRDHFRRSEAHREDILRRKRLFEAEEEAAASRSAPSKRAKKSHAPPTVQLPNHTAGIISSTVSISLGPHVHAHAHAHPSPPGRSRSRSHSQAHGSATSAGSSKSDSSSPREPARSQVIESAAKAAKIEQSTQQRQALEQQYALARQQQQHQQQLQQHIMQQQIQQQMQAQMQQQAQVQAQAQAHAQAQQSQGFAPIAPVPIRMSWMPPFSQLSPSSGKGVQRVAELHKLLGSLQRNPPKASSPEEQMAIVAYLESCYKQFYAIYYQQLAAQQLVYSGTPPQGPQQTPPPVPTAAQLSDQPQQPSSQQQQQQQQQQQPQMAYPHVFNPAMYAAAAHQYSPQLAAAAAAANTLAGVSNSRKE